MISCQSFLYKNCLETGLKSAAGKRVFQGDPKISLEMGHRDGLFCPTMEDTEQDNRQVIVLFSKALYNIPESEGIEWNAMYHPLQ